MKIQVFLLCLISIFITSCNELREEDKAKLLGEAAKGNPQAMQMVYRLQRSGAYGDLIDEKTCAEYEKRSLENGFYEVIKLKIEDEKKESSAPDIDIALKWERYGAEHGSVACMRDLGKYYYDKGTPEDRERGLYWTRMAADSSCAIAQMRLLRWENKKVYMPTWSLNLGAEGWKVTEGGNLIARFTSWTVHFVPAFFLDIFKYLFSSEYWWQGLLGLIAFLIVLISLKYLPQTLQQSIHRKADLPMLWTMIYGGLNGSFMVFCHYDGLINSEWMQDNNYMALNIGRFTYGPMSVDVVSDIFIYASWIWLVGLVGIFLYLAFKHAVDDGGQWLWIALSVLLGYFYGAALSLVVVFILLPAFIILLVMSVGSKFSGSSSSSSGKAVQANPYKEDWDVTVKDDYGNERKLKQTGMFGDKFKDIDSGKNFEKTSSGDYVEKD